jgi:hypothetical protein
MTKTRPRPKSPPTDALTERLLSIREVARGQKPVPGTKERVCSPRLALKATMAIARLHGVLDPGAPVPDHGPDLSTLTDAELNALIADLQADTGPE